MESPLDPNNLMSYFPQGFEHRILDGVDKAVNDFVNNVPEIEITKIEPDYRSPRNDKNKFHVNYQILDNKNPIEIEGTLTPYHTGKSVEYGFEPGYFDAQETEQYWDANWERIEDEIMAKLHEIM